MKKPQRDVPNEQWQHESVPSAIRAASASKGGAAELLQAFDQQHARVEETALQHLLGRSAPAEKLSVEAAAAFPSLALFTV